MPTLALVAQAPGSGRTSLAMALTLAAARARVCVTAADLDPAGDLSGRLRDRFEDPDYPWDVPNFPRGISLRSPTADTFDRAVAAVFAQEATDLLILDTADGLGMAVEDALSISDLALVPVRPDPIALRAAQAAATRLLYLRVAFSFVAVGQDAERAVPALKGIGPVAGTLSDPDALLRRFLKQLSGRPPIQADAIIQARLDRREARRVEREVSPNIRSTARRTTSDRLRPLRAA